MTPSLRTATIRLLRPDDDLVALTELIHTAYAPHAAAGLRYWGTHQSLESTAERLASGTAWVMTLADEYVGTATLRPAQAESPVSLYRTEGVFSLAQFCVAPGLKGQGYGRRLHEHVLAHARAIGARGIALDTARPATRLIAMYERWGYKIAGEADWRPHTNYTSVVMYLPLSEPSRAA